jgi:hypothetical protein
MYLGSSIWPARRRSSTLATVSSLAGQGRAVFVYHTGGDAGEQRLVSIVDPDTVFASGLCPEAILGTLLPGADGRLSPDAFRPNPVFIEYLGRLIAENIGHVEGVRLEAQRQGSGYVCILDGRTATPEGVVPPSDIIGAVDVNDGEVVPDSYQHNPNHRLLTGDGFFVLPPEIETLLQDDLRNRCHQRRTD